MVKKKKKSKSEESLNEKLKVRKKNAAPKVIKKQYFHCDTHKVKRFRRMTDHRRAVGGCRGKRVDCPGDDNCGTCQKLAQGK